MFYTIVQLLMVPVDSFLFIHIRNRNLVATPPTFQCGCSIQVSVDLLLFFSFLFRFRLWCQRVIGHKMFDHVILLFIFLNCITIALERPDIQPNSMVTSHLQSYVQIQCSQVYSKTICLYLRSLRHLQCSHVREKTTPLYTKNNNKE